VVLLVGSPLDKETTVPKQKTHKGAAKRFRVNANGKVKRGHSGHTHILTKKSSKRKRKLRQQTEVSDAFEKMIRGLLH
jgi:large subunit ribosomal protein L35